jgi:hypothetical protein
LSIPPQEIAPLAANAPTPAFQRFAITTVRDNGNLPVGPGFVLLAGSSLAATPIRALYRFAECDILAAKAKGNCPVIGSVQLFLDALSYH